MEILFYALMLGLIPAMIAQSKGRSFGAWWFYGAALFVIALPHSLIMSEDKKHIEAKQLSEGMKKCPFCAELIKSEAVKCKHCFEHLEIDSGEADEYSCPDDNFDCESNTAASENDEIKATSIDNPLNSPLEAEVCGSCGKKIEHGSSFCNNCKQLLLSEDEIASCTNELISKKRKETENLKIVLSMVGVAALFILAVVLIIPSFIGRKKTSYSKASGYSTSKKQRTNLGDTLHFTCSNGGRTIKYAIDILPVDSISALRKQGQKRCTLESGIWNSTYHTTGVYKFSTTQF